MRRRQFLKFLRCCSERDVYGNLSASHATNDFTDARIRRNENWQGNSGTRMLVSKSIEASSCFLTCHQKEALWLSLMHQIQQRPLSGHYQVLRKLRLCTSKYRSIVMGRSTYLWVRRRYATDRSSILMEMLRRNFLDVLEFLSNVRKR